MVPQPVAMEQAAGRAPQGRGGKDGQAECGHGGSVRPARAARSDGIRVAQRLAEEQARNAGILGVLRQTEGSHTRRSSPQTPRPANDGSDVLGGLIGPQIGEAYGVGGLGLDRHRMGGGGSEGTMGLGNLGTISRQRAAAHGYGRRGAGGLGGRRAGADVIAGMANVRGSLDKEIIRRIIRRHINEVKYCYEQELTKKPDLGGRIMVQFTIAASGRSSRPVLQNSTMGNARVENCTSRRSGAGSSRSRSAAASSSCRIRSF